MIWQDLHHSQLDTATLYQILKLRSEVFVVEQTCVYQDVDGEDLRGENRHILGFCDGELVAYARILAQGQKAGQVAIGRVIVAPDARGEGLGYSLMQAAIAACEKGWPQALQVIGAQAHLQGFYRQLGFIAKGDVYDEDGIAHIVMCRLPGTQGAE